MLVVDARGLPIGLHVDSASPAEISLAETTLSTIRVPRKGVGRPRTRPKELVADKGYDSRALRASLRHRGIKPTIPTYTRRASRKPRRGRPMRTGPNLANRWKIERSFSWLYGFRRLRIRYERYLHTYRGFCLLALIVVSLRTLLK
jgi:transposase